jgi:hypothetical protein
VRRCGRPPPNAHARSVAFVLVAGFGAALEPPVRKAIEVRARQRSTLGRHPEIRCAPPRRLWSFRARRPSHGSPCASPFTVDIPTYGPPRSGAAPDHSIATARRPCRRMISSIAASIVARSEGARPPTNYSSLLSASAARVGVNLRPAGVSVSVWNLRSSSLPVRTMSALAASRSASFEIAPRVLPMRLAKALAGSATRCMSR